MLREFARVHSTFWTGQTGKRIRALGPECQVVAVYLITAPTANALGLYYLPLPTLSHETGIPSKGALKALQRLSEAGFCSYDAGMEWIFVPKMARFQIGDRLEPDDNRVKWLRRELETLRKAPFFNDFLALYKEAFHLEAVSPSEAPLESLPRDNSYSYLNSNSDLNRNLNRSSDPTAWFNEVFAPAYPRSEQRASALAAIRKMKPTPDKRTEIMENLEAWKASAKWQQDPTYIPGMGKFFSEGHYQRQPPIGSHSNGARPNGRASVVEMAKTLVDEASEGK